ncbi:recombinase family protein [Leptotrichia trevisanii]|uniref:recombinase family protein n=1 Tax=Leptotrichia trevisanii TaxID=109328 RepID=UPI0026E9E5C9|nr:recombinase family protein [Leptotrichia trevisanii]
MRYGYARISTREQDEARQIEVLRQAGVQEIIIEKASGKNFIDRTEWQKLMAKVVVDDVIVVKSLDRLGRNNAEIKETFELLSKKQVYLEFIDNAILNTKAVTEAEKLNKKLVHPIVLHLLGYFAECELKLIKERQSEAYRQLETDEKGRKLSNRKFNKDGSKKICGRPNKMENLTKKQKDIINRWILKAIKTSEAIQLTGLSRSTLFRIKKNCEQEHIL